MKKMISFLALITLLLANLSCTTDSEELQIENNVIRKVNLNEIGKQVTKTVKTTYQYREAEEPYNPKPRR